MTQNRHPYSYVILRYRHDTLIGEFANVGVVVHMPNVGITVRMRKSLGRLPKMFPGLNASALRRRLSSIEKAFVRSRAQKGAPLFDGIQTAETIARSMLPNDDASFVWSDCGSGLGVDIEQVADEIFERFVTRYDEKTTARRDDEGVWKPVKDLLAERELLDRLTSVSIHSSFDEVEFEHAWKNGRWNCFKPLSFDLASAEGIRDKAKLWAGQVLALQETETDYKLYFIVGAPSQPAFASAYEQAIEILQLGAADEERVEVVQETAIAPFVDRLEDEIRHHEQTDA